MQDAGVFVTSHSTGTTATAVFNGFTVADGAVPPPPGPTSYEAESSSNTLAGGARIASCTACSGGKKVGFVGSGGTLTFNGVTAATAGDYQVTLVYLDGSTTGRSALVTVDGGTAQPVSFVPTGDFNTIGTKTITVQLNAGANTIMLSNPTDFAPDFDRILVAVTPSS